MKGKEKCLKGVSKVPKPTSYKALQHSKRNKQKYLSTEKTIPYNSNTRNNKDAEVVSLPSMQKMHRMKSTVPADSDDLNLEGENFELDKVSQYSMNIKSSDTQTYTLEKRSHSNSFSNSNSQSGLRQSKDEILDLSEKNLIQVPVKLIDKMRLQVLKLSKNSLVVLPDKICELIFLKKLLVDNNMLKTLPSNIRKLTRLKVFDFHSNKIEEIPKEIGE